MRNLFPRQDKICHLEPLKAQPEIPKAQQDNQDDIPIGFWDVSTRLVLFSMFSYLI